MQEKWHHYRHQKQTLSFVLKSLDTINNAFLYLAIILYRAASTCDQICYTKTLFLIINYYKHINKCFKKCIKKSVHILQNEDIISQCLL